MDNSSISLNRKAAQAYASKLNWAVFPLHTPNNKHCSCQNPNCPSLKIQARSKIGLIYYQD
ncbi:hypothetical protein QFZ73_001973 [Peribacillus sp. V2I11]|nr:hypothetical protein [Peribacillus sp. V2I11]